MRQWGVNNLPEVVAQQRHGRGSNPRPEPALGNAGPGAAGVWYAAGRRGGVWGGAVPLPSGGF